ncbi:hypothetical protein [Burkholderia guangdongensis]|uniref:hypothetical protein n=1 Tax=Burkholderia guangdongensis TaxID=1792500 RepID=UPI0015CB7F7E|nr:hypothetical protein [Burkholderia guangdongensis]
MRNLARLSFASMAVALALASLPLVASAQDAVQADASGIDSSTSLAIDATWMKRYTPLDEDTLDQQRGRAPGFVTIATTPQMANGTSVTLWDEIAPPAPAPVPVDAQRAMQGNSASYTRK